jgi:hypothetical protein
MEEPIYDGIGRLVTAGATLEDVTSYIDSRNPASSEEQRSATWLRDWHAWERALRPAHRPAPQPLE